jgi:type II secretory pathway component PulF
MNDPLTQLPPARAVLSYQLQDEHDRSVLGRAFSIVWRTLAALLLPVAGLGSAFLLGAFYGGAAVAYVAPLLVVLLGTSLLAARVKRLDQDVQSVLHHIQQAVEVGLPLPQAAHAAAMSERGRVRRSLMRFGQLVMSGAPLGSALNRSMPWMPLRVRSILALTHGAVDLGLAAARFRIESRTRMELVRRLGTALNYALLCTLLLLLASMFVLILCVPKLNEIASDFGVKVSPVWFFLRGGDGVGVWIVTVIMVLVLMVYMKMCVELGAGLGVFRPWFVVRIGMVDRLTYRLGWLMPAARHRQLADVCRSIAASVRAHEPLADAIRSSAMPHLNLDLSGRLHAAANAVETGQTPATAMRESQLPVVMCDAFACARGPDAIIASMSMLGRWFEDRTESRMLFLARVAPVLVMLLIAVLVGIWSYGLFDTLNIVAHSIAPQELGW